MTLRSMTGIGRARGPVGSDRVAELSVRSVNHRSLDLNVKLREPDAALEPVVRRVFSERLARGKVDVAVQVRRLSAGTAQIVVDEGLLEALLSRLQSVARKHGLGGDLAVRDLLVIPQLFSVENGSAEYTPEELADVERLAGEAISSLVSMREIEGGRLARELSQRIDWLQGRLAQLETRREEIVGNIRTNFRERLRLLLADIPVDSGRLEQEAALLADRSDVSEELNRLGGHLAQFAELVASTEGPIGKKLEFLAQEILRELNTLGAKARDLQLVREVVEMKSETEKIREQVQNVE